MSLPRRPDIARTALEILEHIPTESMFHMWPTLPMLGLWVIAGATKLGKTQILLHVAWSLTTGRPLWGVFEPHLKARVLLVELEVSEHAIRERLTGLVPLLDWDQEALERFTIACRRGLFLDAPEGDAALDEIIASNPGGPPDVLIIDSYNAGLIGDPDRTEPARRALANLRQRQEKYGSMSVIATSELRKQPAGIKRKARLDDLRGNSSIAYDADAVTLLRPVGESGRQIEVAFPAIRHAESPTALQIVRREQTFDLEIGDKRGAIEHLLRARIAEGASMTARDARDAVRNAGLAASHELVDEVRRKVLR